MTATIASTVPTIPSRIQRMVLGVLIWPRVSDDFLDATDVIGNARVPSLASRAGPACKALFELGFGWTVQFPMYILVNVGFGIGRK